MSKYIREKIKLISTSNTNHFYTTTKNKRLKLKKLILKKFDPILQHHVIYKEGKLKKF